jgi:hypothetical protein
MKLTTLQAGATLDALVAEKVLGCTVKSVKRCQTGDDQTVSFECRCDGRVHNKSETGELMSPSTNRAAAMEVVDWMRADGFSFKVWQPKVEPRTHGDPPRLDALVSFVCGMGPCEKHGNTVCNHHGAYDVQAETLPLAISKAALIALKVIDDVGVRR